MLSQVVKELEEEAKNNEPLERKMSSGQQFKVTFNELVKEESEEMDDEAGFL